MATPITCSPCDAYCFCRSTNHGISILQGAHQVAQKFSSTALPRKSESRTGLPSRLFNSKSGATDPFLPTGLSLTTPVLGLAMRTPANSMRATAAITTIITIALRFTAPHNAKRFRNDSQADRMVKWRVTISAPMAISSTPLATSTACRCRRKRA